MNSVVSTPAFIHEYKPLILSMLPSVLSVYRPKMSHYVFNLLKAPVLNLIVFFICGHKMSYGKVKLVLKHN